MIKRFLFPITTGLFLSGCVVKQVVMLPLDVADAAITTTSNAVELVGTVAKTSAEIGSKIVESSKPEIPPVSISVE